MIRKAGTIAMTVLVIGAVGNLALGQTPPPSTLTIDVANVVEYQGVISDPSKFATNPNITPSAGARVFTVIVGFGDIVAVNGQPAKGVYVFRPVGIGLTPTPAPGQAIADTTHASLKSHTFEILKSDGTPVGTMMGFGLDGGLPPPGAPSYPVATRGNYTIIGGTGAFLGARGELVQRQQVLEAIPPRGASMAEDPANRRINGGGNIRFFLHVIPLTTPQIATTPAGPAVTHSNDFTLVTASKPAAAGEILSIFATGLGPTNPGVDPGQPFPSSPAAAVNSPVDVTVNGKSAEVLAAVGYPGAVDGYQVNFRVPPVSLCKLSGVKLCTLFGVSQARAAMRKPVAMLIRDAIHFCNAQPLANRRLPVRCSNERFSNTTRRVDRRPWRVLSEWPEITGRSGVIRLGCFFHL
jgi:uncharacterized protein (TIGR03437 family)